MPNQALSPARPRYDSRIWLSALILSLGLGTAQAEIVFGDGSADGVARGQRGELLLMVWDWDKQVSYTRDLGILSYTEALNVGDPSKDLFVYGQQDAGYQKIFDPLNTDLNFQKFLQTSTDRTKQIWAIVGGSTNPDLSPAAGGLSAFLTIRHDAPTGTVDPDYTKLRTWNNENFQADFAVSGYMTDLNGALSGNPAFNTHRNSSNGSSFNATPEAGYVGTLFSNGRNAGLGASAPVFFNTVGNSSWFYFVTTSTDNGADPVSVDEFDNLKHDAYWGLGVDSSGNYILSYTLEGALTQATTAAGRVLRLNTDYAAAYGSTRLISLPDDPFAGVAATVNLGSSVTAVPEPATWGLMGLGLAAVVGAARRRQARTHAA